MYSKPYDYRDRKRFTDQVNNIDVQRYNDFREVFDDAVRCNITSSEKQLEFRERDINAILVNQIRHGYTNYEKSLKQIRKIRKNEELYYRRYKNVVLDKISEKYPQLRYACKKQKYSINIVNITKS